MVCGGVWVGKAGRGEEAVKKQRLGSELEDGEEAVSQKIAKKQ